MVVAQLFRGPHNLYRRYQTVLESGLTALALGLLITLVLNGLGVYPYNWVVVIGIAVTLLGIRWPLAAYILSVGVMLYPLYTINLYLAVLFMAVAALGQRLFVHYLGATLLVLATPLLAQYHLHWLVPVLAGLWWGGSTGIWVGLLAALWGKILGGMAGLNLDWLVLAGQIPAAAAIEARFEAANSLETLLLLVEPFAATSSVVLYNLLQIIGWGMAGGFVGFLAGRKWVKYRTPWSILVVSAGGGLIMMVTHLGLPYWLGDALSEEAIVALQNPTGPLFSLLIVIIVATLVYSVRETLDLPVAPPRPLWKKSRKRKPRRIYKSPLGLLAKKEAEKSPLTEEETVEEESYTRRPRRVPHHSELPEWEPPQDETGLIMLEID